MMPGPIEQEPAGHPGRRDAAARDAGTEFRRYWNSRLRMFMAAYELLLLAAFAVAIATAGAHASWSIALPWIILFPVAFFGIAFAIVRAGVYETQLGITSRAGGYGFDVAWAEIAAFDYGRRRGTEVVVVQRVDGGRRELRGAARRMRWRDGATEDFAALLTERLSQHHTKLTP
jgi:hypothetical protein